MTSLRNLLKAAGLLLTSAFATHGIAGDSIVGRLGGGIEMECAYFAINEISSFDFATYEDSYHDTVLLSGQAKLPGVRTGANEITSEITYVLRSGYDVESDSEKNSTYKVTVVHISAPSQVTCRVTKIEETRQR